MKTLFRLIPATGILTLCVTAFAADPASIPPRDAASAASTPSSSITLHFPGAQRISADSVGGLEIIRKDGTLRRYRPELFQVVGGKRREVRFTYHVVDRDHVELRAVHTDPSAPLQVEPAHARTNS